VTKHIFQGLENTTIYMGASCLSIAITWEYYIAVEAEDIATANEVFNNIFSWSKGGWYQNDTF
jgi:hypothetical protein